MLCILASVLILEIKAEQKSIYGDIIEMVSSGLHPSTLSLAAVHESEQSDQWPNDDRDGHLSWTAALAIGWSKRIEQLSSVSHVVCDE